MDAVSSAGREFIEFWIENSVHAAEQYGNPGAEQDVAELTRRCLEMANSQGIPAADIEAEVGDIADYIRGKLAAANKAETDRRRP
jgi:hypothetical protein